MGFRYIVRGGNMKYDFQENGGSGKTLDADAQSLTISSQAENGVVEVPLGTFLFDAQYAKDGNHLVLTDLYDREVTVEHFFSHDTLPKLVNEWGAGVEGTFAAKLAGPGQVAQSTNSSTDLGKPIGSVESLEGTATVQHANGVSEPLVKGSKIYADDIIETGGDAAVGVLLADDSVFSVGANSRMVVDNFVYDAASGDGNLGISFLKGAFSFVSGKIAQNDYSDVDIKVPFGSIGIRGTEFVVDIGRGRTDHGFGDRRQCRHHCR